MRLLVLLYTMSPRVIVWKEEKRPLEPHSTPNQPCFTALFTHIDNRVCIHQFCDRLNPFQGDLQFVSFTVNHPLSVTQDTSLSGAVVKFWTSVQKDLEIACRLTLIFSPVRASSSDSFPMVKLLTRTFEPVVMVTLKSSPFSSISETLFMSLPFWMSSSGRPAEKSGRETVTSQV